MGDQRHGPARFLLRYAVELLVLVLLAGAVASYRFDLGARFLGQGPADPTTAPAQVLPPEGLKLPDAGAVRLVARPGAHATPDPAKVSAAVRPLLRKRVLGRHFAVLVTDLRTGHAVYRVGAATITPASTTKLLTSTAALEALGPMARFRTTVRWVPQTRTLVLVGGGDPFLSSTPRLGRASYPLRADLTTLAQRAVRALRAQQGAQRVGRVRLAFDDSYFSGPSVNPAWPDTYIPEDVVPPISALWVDEARSGLGFVDDPATDAADVFRSKLEASGLKVLPRVARAVAPADSRDLAAVSSAPLGEIVERTLAVSDNQAAEVLARHVGLAERQEGSSVAGTSAVLGVLRRLGVPTTGDVLHDGSGLSRENRLSPATLAGVLRLSEEDAHPELRQVFTGLPVAGFTGSLTYRFDEGPDAAKGRVRAKTGTLTGVHGLAGVADDVSGSRMGFVLVADQVDPEKELEAQTLIDRIAGALGACRCGVGSSS